MERSKLANQYHETGYSCAQSVACVFPESVIPSPDVVMAPNSISGETRYTFLPDFAALIAATTPPEVPPYMTISPV